MVLALPTAPDVDPYAVDAQEEVESSSSTTTPNRAALRINLEARGHAVAIAETAADALVAASAQPPDVVLLDLGLPDRDGIDVIHGIRGWSDVPILVLSGRSGGPDKVAALNATPTTTSPSRSDRGTPRPGPCGDPAGRGRGGAAVRVALGDVVVDLARRSVTREGAGGIREDIHMTPTEWHLLEVLARNPGRLLQPALSPGAGVGGGVCRPARQPPSLYEPNCAADSNPSPPVRGISSPNPAWAIGSRRRGMSRSGGAPG